MANTTTLISSTAGGQGPLEPALVEHQTRQPDSGGTGHTRQDGLGIGHGGHPVGSGEADGFDPPESRRRAPVR